MLASEATPIWDTLATGDYREHAVIVYPQALSPGGDAMKRTVGLIGVFVLLLHWLSDARGAASNTHPPALCFSIAPVSSRFQFWNIPFWHCSVGVCADPAVDDQGFIEKVLLLLPMRLNVDRKKVRMWRLDNGGFFSALVLFPLSQNTADSKQPTDEPPHTQPHQPPRQIFMSGTSAGGMMVHNLLCRSTVVGRTVSAAVDMLGGLGAQVTRGACRPAKSVPFRIVHGEVDEVLKFNEPCEVDGASFMSTSEWLGFGR